MAQFPFTSQKLWFEDWEYSYSVPVDLEGWLEVKSYISGTESPQIILSTASRLGLQVWYPMTPPETLFPKPD